MRKFFVVFIIFWGVLALAEDKLEEKKEDESQGHILRFDESLKGEQSKPQISTLFKNKKFNFRKIIKLRENFIPEMNSTLQTLPRE